jgi:eukaryotic-like serine/threonine-protein kinase
MNDDRPDDRLDLWKDIATYLNRGVSTVQRWEKREGMPVHRHLHDKLGSVYAFRSELDEWWASRRARLEQEDPALPDTGDVPPRPPARSIVPAFVAGALVAFMLGLLFTAVRTPAASKVGVVRFQVPAPAGLTWDSAPSAPYPAVSPDGRHIAVIATGPEGRNHLWVQALDTQAPRLVADTEDASYPFWSPDSRFVAYPAHGALRKVRASGGPPETICVLSSGGYAARDSIIGSGTWSATGQILFSDATGLSMVAASGGEPVAITKLDATRGETSHRFPQFLPDGRRFIYLVRSTQAEHQGIYLGSLDSTERTRISDADSNAAYADDGYLLFIREATLIAQRFDPDRRRLTGEALPLGTAVVRGPTVRFAPFSASSTVLAFRSGAVTPTQLVRVDRRGRTLAAIGDPGPYPANPSLSPDGTQIAMALLDLQTGRSDIWLFDVVRGVRSRFTSHPAFELAPLWAADGRSILFASNRNGRWDIYERRLGETSSLDREAERPVIESPTNKYPLTWGADGRTLVFTRLNAQTGEDLWLKAPTGEETIFLQTAFDEREPQLSPDGRWMAYTSNESGQPEVYVRSFPAAAGVWKVSVNGGAEPRWRADARELFYVGPDRRMMAVSIAGGTTFTPGMPAALFHARIAETPWWDYIVLPGGQEFVIKQASAIPSSPLSVVLNWREGLRP